MATFLAPTPVAPSYPLGLILPLVLLFGTTSGLSTSLAKVAVTGGVSAAGYALWVCLGAGAILLIVALVRRTPMALDRHRLRYGAVVGIAGLALPTVNTVTVLDHVPVGVAMLLAPLTPLLTYAFSHLAGLERYSGRRALGVALGLGGALLIIVPRSSLPSPDMANWVMLGLLTPVMHAGTNVYAAIDRPAGSTSLALAVGMQLTSAAALVPVVFLLGLYYTPHWPLGAPEGAILGHVALATLGTMMFFEITRRAGPVVLSQVAYVVTLTGVMWGMVFFGETHSHWFWAAMLVIFAGVALATQPGRAELTKT